ncbi:MAG: hypothetical protein V4633_16335 [Pseudomonadota bacterium]
MKPKVAGPWLSYTEITDRTTEQIRRYVEESQHRTGLQALVRREWAYGAYMGWRALMVDMNDQLTFLHDDQRLEALLIAHEPL